MLRKPGEYSTQFNQQYSKEQESAFKEEFSKITLNFLNSKKEGLSPSNSKVQDLVKQHFDFVSKFWKPNKEAYKNLAMNYILPTAFNDYYEEIEKGLGKYTYDAVVIWANKNL